MNIPKTKKENIIEEINGIKIADPYRWLENGEKEEVKEWIKTQNEYTHSILNDSTFDIFSNELVKNSKTAVSTNPLAVKGLYFYEERKPDQDQFVLYVKKGLDGVPVVLFDPNGKTDGNTINIDYWCVSKTGKYVAYGISEGGNEMPTLYIKDVNTNVDLSEKIVHCRYSSISWLPDETAFFYTRNPRPGTVSKNEEYLHTKVYFHKLGDNPDNDELIFGADRPKDDLVHITLSLDGKYLGVHVTRNFRENEIYIYDRNKKETKPLVVGIPAKSHVIFLKDKVLLNTNYRANNYRTLVTTYEDLYKPIDEWENFIPERQFSLEEIYITKDKILMEYLVNACSKVFIFDHDGKEIGEIPLPKYSSLWGVSVRRNEEEFFYGVTSFVFPKIIYRYDPVMMEYSEYKKTDNPIDPDDYDVKQEWYVSKDNTKVPMFIFYKKGIALDGKNPTVLYGYGGFGSSETPSFYKNWIPWFERGGIFAIANIRGGGEFGVQWHKGGIGENKQNSFDDFISAGEYLISQKYTSKEYLGILGGSNGGLLVSAVAVQRPDLFKAVCSRVPLTDMVRFSKFGIAVRWIHEYGNPEIKDDLEGILKWSPYHNVNENVLYPSFLLTTANNDTRVEPFHARKMTALLQNGHVKNKTLLFTEMDAGHGAGKSLTKMVENQAQLLSFFAKELGLKM